MKSIKYKKDKLYIENFNIFNAFNTIMKLFFTIVYIRITTLTWIFRDHPLVEYPLFAIFDSTKSVEDFCVSRVIYDVYTPMYEGYC